MVAQTQLMTADQLLALPDDGYRYELVRGELRKMPPAGFEHGELSLDIGTSLSLYVRAHNLGKALRRNDTGFLIGSDPDHVRAPDIAFVRRERLEAAAGRITGYFPGPPDLAIEVISPHDRYTEVAEKVADWLAAGVQLVILVAPRRRSVTCHTPNQTPVTLTEQDTLDGSPVLPGWQMPVSEIFA